MNLSFATYKKLGRNPGYVYFIECNGLVKIGQSAAPEKRLAGLQTASPFELAPVGIYKTDDMTWLEKNLHLVFCDERVRGEWFDIVLSDINLAVTHLLTKAEPYFIPTQGDKDLRRRIEKFSKDLHWSYWFDISLREVNCQVCGVSDERRKMTELEGYERFVICQRCADPLFIP